ncbi:MAG: maturase [Opitutaceae bacterium]|nr:maturase [Opitutaceae bacterium]
MAAVVRFVEGKLKLLVNAAKSRVAPPAHGTLLGFRFSRGEIRWSHEAGERFVTEVRSLTGRTWSVSMGERLLALRRYMTGWINFYRLGRNYAEVQALDRWVRRRVRQCYRKQWKRPRCRRRNLLRLGADPEQVHLCSRSRKAAGACRPTASCASRAQQRVAQETRGRLPAGGLARLPLSQRRRTRR